MEAKIKNGGTHYDVAFPSEYTVQKLKREHLLEPLDHQKIPNIKNLDSDYMNMAYDHKIPIQYPIFGTVGILYNKKRILMNNLIVGTIYISLNTKMTYYLLTGLEKL